MPRLKLWNELGYSDSLASFDILCTDACLAYAIDIATGQFSGDISNVNRNENINVIPFNALLKNALDSQRLEVMLRHMQPINCKYQAMRIAYQHYKSLVDSGGFEKIPDSAINLKPGEIIFMVKPLVSYLIQTGDLDKFINKNSTIFNADIQDAVKHFQNRHGIQETGLVNAITIQAMQVPAEERAYMLAANMERLRWLPGDMGQEFVMVNIADYTLAVQENYNTLLKMKIIVGKPFKQTPVFHAHLKYVVINPTWDVPQSIIEEEIIPEMRKNPGYLSRNHMKLYTQDGMELNPYHIAWWKGGASRRGYRVKQIPGPWNALGQIKFLFPNPFSVYLHGTPHQELFSRDVRTFSHGCMRVENPIALAEIVLKNTKGWDRQNIEKQIGRKTEYTVVLKNEIPVHVTYQTAWIDDDDKLCFRNDIYGRDVFFKQFIFYKKAARPMMHS